MYSISFPEVYCIRNQFLVSEAKNKSSDNRDLDADPYIVDELKCSPVNPEAPPTEF